MRYNEGAFSIRVGAAGHRLDQLDSVKSREVAERIAVVLASLYELEDDPNVGEEPISIVTSLAEGADRIFASQAITSGIPVHVLLPASPAIFQEDFGSLASRVEFQNLLGKATSIQIVGDDGLPVQNGYEAVGQKLVEMADIMLVVWDGRMGRGPGGTADTIEQALEAGKPVIWISSTRTGDISLIVPRTGLPDRFLQLENWFPVSSLVRSGISGK